MFVLHQSMGSVLSLSAVSQTDSITSTRSLAHGGAPELLIGLSYNATTGRMSVELIKGSHFRNLAIARPPGLKTHTHTHCIYIYMCVSIYVDIYLNMFFFFCGKSPSSVQTPTPG